MHKNNVFSPVLAPLAQLSAALCQHPGTSACDRRCSWCQPVPAVRRGRPVGTHRRLQSGRQLPLPRRAEAALVRPPQLVRARDGDPGGQRGRHPPDGEALGAGRLATTRRHRDDLFFGIPVGSDATLRLPSSFFCLSVDR